MGKNLVLQEEGGDETEWQDERKEQERVETGNLLSALSSQ